MVHRGEIGPRNFAVLTLFIVTALLLSGCGKEKKDTIYPGALLTSTGFDFSAGALISNEFSDGRVVVLAPPPNATPAGMDAGYLWFWPVLNTSSQNYTRDMGEVELESVNLVPGDWDGGPGVPLQPLITGHVYITKCKDGYVKFLVKALDPSKAEMGVEYSYSSTESFSK